MIPPPPALGLRHPGARLRPGAVHVPALGHRRASTRSRSVIRRNAALLPAYSFLLGLLALLGFVAIAAGVKVANPQQAVPQLFENEFPPRSPASVRRDRDRCAGAGAIMSIAAANLWTRNIYRAFINPTPRPRRRRSRASWSRWW